MANFKVIRAFTDLTDDNHVYLMGDDYPREGLAENPERINELSSKGNKQGTPLIQSTESQKKPTKRGRKPSK